MKNGVDLVIGQEHILPRASDAGGMFSSQRILLPQTSPLLGEPVQHNWSTSSTD